MIFGYESLLMKFRECSEEKVKSAIIATWYGDTLTALGLAILIIIGISFIPNVIVFYVLYILILIVLFFYIVTRKSSLGITKNNFVYIKFTHLFYKVKEVYEVRFENVKDIKIKRFLGVNNVVMTFVSNDKKFRRVKFKFVNNIIGMSEQKKSSKEIYAKLKELQKEIDRGDF